MIHFGFLFISNRILNRGFELSHSIAASLLQSARRHSTTTIDTNSVSHSVVRVGIQIFFVFLGAASAFLASTLSRPVMLADFTGADVQFD